MDKMDGLVNKLERLCARDARRVDQTELKTAGAKAQQG